MTEAESYPYEWAWTCPHCNSTNISEDSAGIMKCIECGKKVKVKELKED